MLGLFTTKFSPCYITGDRLGLSWTELMLKYWKTTAAEIFRLSCLPFPLTYKKFFFCIMDFAKFEF